MTNQTIPQPLRDEFTRLIKKGDETAARKFLVEHLKEFPEDTQDEIIFAFFKEAIAKKSEGEEALSEFRAKGLKILDKLGRAKDELEKEAKLEEIREDVKK